MGAEVHHLITEATVTEATVTEATEAIELVESSDHNRGAQDRWESIGYRL